MSFEIVLQIFYWILRIYSGIILIDVILSWIPSLYQYKIFRGINKMASFVLEPFRGCVIARLDFSLVIAIVLLNAISTFIYGY